MLHRDAPQITERLANRVGGPLVPVLVGRRLLRREDLDEAVGEAVHPVGARDVAVKTGREKLGENEDLPNTTNPDDWARISGRKGERIINVRTLITGMERKEQTIETVKAGQGQYL